MALHTSPIIIPGVRRHREAVPVWAFHRVVGHATAWLEHEVTVTRGRHALVGTIYASTAVAAGVILAAVIR